MLTHDVTLGSRRVCDLSTSSGQTELRFIFVFELWSNILIFALSEVNVPRKVCVSMKCCLVEHKQYTDRGMHTPISVNEGNVYGEAR